MSLIIILRLLGSLMSPIVTTTVAFQTTTPPPSSLLHHYRRRHFNSIIIPSLFSPSSLHTTSTTTSSRQGLLLHATNTDDDTITTTTTTTTTTTISDDTITSPSSLLFYDDVIDDSLPEGVVCARGVCVLSDIDGDITEFSSSEADDDKSSWWKGILNSYWGPRLFLAGASILYGTNFPLGAIMNQSLPPSAATVNRMVLASLALSPFLLKLSPRLSKQAFLCGCFTALGYITQSLALMDVSPATVAFLGAVTVIVCPTLSALIDKKPMSPKDAPQVWLAALLCLTGVGILELYDPTAASTTTATSLVGWGDVLSILQAVGFGTSFFLTERMMRREPDQALPITAVQVSVTALGGLIWCLGDGWIGTEGSEGFGMLGLFSGGNMAAAGAVVWTGLITTALNRVVETASLGKVSSAEASVILATEPLWAALFAALWLSSEFGINDYIGGALIVGACLVNTLKPEDLLRFIDDGSSGGERVDQR